MSEPGPAERPYRIAVIGASRATDEDRRAARVLGAELARLGAVVVCGGLGGVMEEVARGARESGGLTVGILPGQDASAANAWIALPLPTGMGHARNAIVVGGSEAVVAVGGAWGTLSEIGLARALGLAVGTVGRPPAEGMGLEALADPREAARWALERARERRGGIPA